LSQPKKPPCLVLYGQQTLKCQLAKCYLFTFADAAQEKEKREKSAAACWRFKVYSSYSSMLKALICESFVLS
jgi:hypothetical protein